MNPRNESSCLVRSISRLMRNIGLNWQGTGQEVHWVAIIATICFLLACILQVIALVMSFEDPEKLFECFSVLAFCGMGVFKLNSLRSYYMRWQFLLNQISKLEEEELNNLFVSDLDYPSDDERSDNFANYVSNYTDKFKTTAKILRKVYNFTAVIFILSPFLEYAFCKFRSNECFTYPHILPGWTPLDNLSIFGYLATVLCEFVAAVYCVCVHVAFDLTAIGIMIFICGQFALLSDYSSRIAGLGKSTRHTKKRDDRARFRIRHCHRISLLLIISINELDKLLNNIIGVYFFVATLTLCSVAVRLNSEEMSSMQLVSLLQYMCGTLTQLFLFCRYGDAVRHEVFETALHLSSFLTDFKKKEVLISSSSINMGEGPFAAAYWCISPAVRRDLLVLSIGMMCPRKLRAGPFNSIDLPSFIQVVRAAYSYYAVLGQK